jgi:lipoprotein-anchoring transpeptidase ErfK/SrfK
VEKITKLFQSRLSRKAVKKETSAGGSRLGISRKNLLIWLAAAVVVVIAGFSFTMWAVFRGKALPGTNVAGVDVSGQTESEIKTVVQNLTKQIKLNLIDGKKIVVANAGDLGIKIDAGKTAAAAVKHSGFVLVSYNPLSAKHIDLSASYDVKAAQNFLNQKLVDQTVAAVNPSVSYDAASNQFVVGAGKKGQAASADNLKAVIADLVARPRAQSVRPKIVQVDPAISDAAAAKAQTYMNQRLGLSLKITHGGRTIYTIDPGDIASWAVFTPDAVSGQMQVSFDQSKIEAFVNGKMSQSLTVSPVNAKVIVDTSGKVLQTLSAGRDGQKPDNPAGLANKIAAALKNNQPLTAELNLTTAAHGTDKIVADDNQWIDVNLTTYTVSLMQDNTAVWSTNQTATGAVGHDTPVGTFRVYSMTPGPVCMPNPPSKTPLCNIHWVTYWHSGGYAFHEAWWLTPAKIHTRLSHGCVNMEIADAKKVYDFARVGMLVYSHY